MKLVAVVFVLSAMYSQWLFAQENGQVLLTILSDYVENGELKSFPIANVGVYKGDWQNGDLLAYTDEAGQILVELPAGENNLSLFKMTSSHSVLQRFNQTVLVSPNETVNAAIHIATEQVLIRAFFGAEFGDALYITGDTDYLGNWEKAIKLTYSEDNYTWTLYDNLPLGAEFKIIKAPWVEASEIDVTGVNWEQGYNHIILKTEGYYETIVEVAPRF